MLLTYYILSWVFFALFAAMGIAAGIQLNTKGVVLLLVSLFGVVLSLVHLIGGSI